MFRMDTQSKLQLRAPKFMRDKPTRKQIEPPLPNCPLCMATFGFAGSGKTSMMANLLTIMHACKKVFHTVHIVMPSHNVASLKRNVFKNHPGCTTR